MFAKAVLDGVPGKRPPVNALETNAWLLWDKPDSTWAWRLTPLPGGQTRLVTRLKQHYRWGSSAMALFTLVLLEFGDFPMMRRMLKGIKVRAEGMVASHEVSVHVATRGELEVSAAAAAAVILAVVGGRALRRRRDGPEGAGVGPWAPQDRRRTSCPHPEAPGLTNLVGARAEMPVTTPATARGTERDRGRPDSCSVAPSSG